MAYWWTRSMGRWSRRIHGRQRWIWGFFSIAGTASASVLTPAWCEPRRKAPVRAEQLVESSSRKQARDYPEITLAEVRRHTKHATGIWITYQGGVYDVTEFVPLHPGGDKILLAAGGAIEPFWNMFGVHKTKETRELLEEYRIGTLPSHEIEHFNLHDPYAHEPMRDSRLVVRSTNPFNAECPVNILVEQDITPEGLHYVRNHLPVPLINDAAYELKIEIPGRDPTIFTLDDLKKYPRFSVTTSIQCAGNRRKSMHDVKAVRGLLWTQGAISTAEWTGVKLRDLLLECGLKEDDPSVCHIVFEGLDRDGDSAYAASIPVEKAMSPYGDVVLAYEMNGKPIPRDYGYPVRAIVPGVVGARNVKWVSRVIADTNESDSHWQQFDYKGFNPCSDWTNLDHSKAKAIQELPVQSAICVPADGAIVELKNDHTIPVRGYAYSGGGVEIIRVDVSMDDGKTWQTAELQSDIVQKPGRFWAMTRWAIDLKVPPSGSRELRLVCRAVDRSYNVQPESPEPLYNNRGVLNSAWHRISVIVK